MSLIIYQKNDPNKWYFPSEINDSIFTTSFPNPIDTLINFSKLKLICKDLIPKIENAEINFINKKIKIWGCKKSEFINFISKTSLQNKIKILDCSEFNCNDNEFATLIKNQKNLESLCFSRLNVTNEIFETMQQLTNLCHLKITFPDLIQDEELQEIIDNNSLQGGAWVDVKSFSHMQKMCMKDQMKLNNVRHKIQFDDELIKKIIKHHQKLKTLSIKDSIPFKNSAITKAIIPVLAKLQNLEKLFLIGPNFGDEDIKSIIKNHPKLKNINFRTMSVSEKTLKKLCKLKHLEKLTFGSFSDGHSNLAQFKKLKTLKIIDFSQDFQKFDFLDTMLGLKKFVWRSMFTPLPKGIFEKLKARNIEVVSSIILMEDLP